MPKFVQSNPDQAYLLPPDLRDWLPENDLAHFILEAVERVPMDQFKVNHRGTGSDQYHPRMMLALLIYGYSNGVFSSRRIERATYRDLGFRFITGNCHPDHDTICAFRRNNLEAFSESFLQVLLLARELKLLKVGRVSVDGTKMKANASKRRSIRYDRAQALREQLQGEIAELVEKAEQSDRESVPNDGSEHLPEELTRRKNLKSQLDDACAKLEKESKDRAAEKQASYEQKVTERESRKGKRKGPKVKPPKEEPEPNAQINLTDSDSALMRKNKQSEYQQAYNAQAVVDADGSQLVLGARVSQCASDRNELKADIDVIPDEVGKPELVLGDNGFANGDDVAQIESDGIEVLVAVGGGDHYRKHDFRPPSEPKPSPEPKAAWLKEMKNKLEKEENKAHYRLRQQTVEPVFGIIKQAMGFRQFLLRGKEKVSTEWLLVVLAYNCKRLNNMMCC